MKPYQVLIFIAVVMGLLGVLYKAFPNGQLLHKHDSEISVEVLENDTIEEFPVFAEAEVEVEAEPDTVIAKEPEVIIPKIAVDSTTDSRVFLSSFYASLAESGNKVVRVLHYGDSQIEEDRMSQQIREALQNKYGGSGAGLLPLAQTIPSRTVKQQLRMNDRWIQPAQGPKRYLVYGPKRDQREDGLYGVMGQVAVMNDSLVKGSEELTAVCMPLDGRKRYTEWRVFADSSVHYSFAGDSVFLSGQGKVYGLSQQSDTGVIVDNIPMRGCLGLVFTKMDRGQLVTFYREQNVQLIIMQFGGNAIPSNKNPGTIQGIVKGLRQQVQYLRACAPQASILFIGPSDMLTQIDGEWQTYPMVPYMDKLLRKMALEENIAYFSLYRWMGGAGSMAHWQEIGLAGSDGVHFTRSGARKAGNAVAEWILEGK